jgi:hypothetical protein
MLLATWCYGKVLITVRIDFGSWSGSRRYSESVLVVEKEDVAHIPNPVEAGYHR